MSAPGVASDPMAHAPASRRSYYGRPVIKEPVWKPQVPWYFFAGGLTGASGALSFAADASGNRTLARRAWQLTLATGTACPALLITDLGRPGRFLNMMRVLKPTSPMSLGSWLLAATGAAAGAATASDALGVMPRGGRAARVATALCGLPLTTYTAALVANTAVPVWHEARRELPFVFAASAGASAGAAALLVTPPQRAGPARRLAAFGAVAEALAATAMERRLGALGTPYRSGAAGRFARAAKALSGCGALVIAAGARNRLVARWSGAGMVLAGAALERWAVFEAGRQSALDPDQTVGPQRRRLAGRAARPGAPT